MDWLAYHDRTGADHQARFDELYPKGWRMISLSVYGARGDERYAAVWVARSGPDWSAVHGVDWAGYQAAFDAAVAAGFRPVLLAATGPANDPVYAGTFEWSPLPTPLTRHALRSGDEGDPATIQHWLRQARDNRWYPTALAVYGAPGDARYAVILDPNPAGICWAADGLLDDHGTHQARFDALAPLGGVPALVAVAPDGAHYAAAFRDDRPADWVARHGMDSAGYQVEFDLQAQQGRIPIAVQGGGVGGGARFAALFAPDDTRLPLVWHPPTGPVAVPSIDAAMRAAMGRHRIRGAGLALVRDGRLVYARGYTYAESGYPAVWPTTPFRQASVSKLVVALAAHRLIQDGALTLGTPVQGLLSLTRPNGLPAPASFSQVTVRHLLEHTSGLPSALYGLDADVAAAFGASLPVSGEMTDRYLVGQPASMPPAPPAYNNWGYFLLGHVVMAATGRPTLIAALDQLLFAPLGITRVRQARSRVEELPADEARYHPTRFVARPSVMEDDRRLRADAFGGAWNLGRDDAGGGLTGAVVDVARLLAMLDVRAFNPVLTPASIANLFTLAQAGGGHGFDTGMVLDAASGRYYGMKGGSIPESNQCCARYMTGDVSMVVCWNRSDIGEGAPPSDGWWYPDFPAVLDAARAHDFAGNDLFPTYGMPSFGVRVTGCLPSALLARRAFRRR